MPLRLISRALPQAFTQMTDYMTSAASNTANTEMLTSVPNTTLNLLSLSLQTINGKDVFDAAPPREVWKSERPSFQLLS